MKRFSSILLLVFIAISSYAQTNVLIPETRTCGTMDHYHKHVESNQDLLHQEEIMNHQVADWVAANPNFNETRATYTMPIVFHVVYNTNSQNISDALILAQLDQINDDFQAVNSDIGGVPSEFPVGNVDIEFCLATIDPNGNATSGITRKQTNQSSFDTSDGVKYNSQGGVNAWDTNTYFNVWITNIVEPNFGDILGYAQFPWDFANSPNTDGLVLGYRTVGSLAQPNPQGGDVGKGRTATHELGHCLGLRHIWGDQDNCSASDLVNDTPVHYEANYGCKTYPYSTCNSNDMTMNYMDYSNDDCMFSFTPGQASRIVGMINSNSYLQNKIAASGQVCGAAAPTAGISGSSSGCAPFSTSFSDGSSSATSWSWSFPGGSPASYSGQNPPTVTYANPGNYTVTLTVSNAVGTDTETISVNALDCSNISCSPIDNLNGATTSLLADTQSGQAGGYVAGNNAFGDLAKAEYFTNISSNSSLNGVEFKFGTAQGSGMIEFVLWADNNGLPGAELATQSISVATIIADVNAGNNTMVDFGGLINIPTSFFIGFKLENGSYIVGLETNSDGDTSPTTSYELYVNSNGVAEWQSFNDGSTTWGYDISMAVYPNICTENGAGQAPTANFTTDITIGCLTGEVDYVDNSTSNPTSWSWSFPGGEPASSTAQNPVVVYTSAGSYSATLTATNALGSSTTTQSDLLVIPELYEPDVTVSTTMVDLNQSGLVTFTDNSPGAIFWFWDFDDNNATADTQTASHTYTSAGTYTATLTVSDGFCTEMFSVDIVVTGSVGVEDIEGLSSMNIYPNPVSETFFVELVSSKTLELEIEMFDATGRKVISNTVNVMGNEVYPIDASGLSAGTYFVRIISGSNTATTKVLKF